MGIIKRISNAVATIRSVNKKFEELECATNVKIDTMQKRLNQLENPNILNDATVDEQTNRSYSQAGEDMILTFVFNQLNIQLKDVTYLDIGANHPIKYSNSYFFYKKKARGVLVEANPDLIPDLEKYRSGDVILNKCISNKSNDKVKFYIMNAPGLSSASHESINEFLTLNPNLHLRQTIDVETITISDIMDKYFNGAPIILDIDIEGKEEDMLDSIDFTKHRPLVIICEMITYDPKHLRTIGKYNQAIMEIMKKNDYVEYAFTGINSIYIDSKKLREII